MFHDANGQLPPARTRWRGLTWAARLLPYLEQTAAFEEFDFTKDYWDQPEAARMHTPSVFFCPTRRGPMVSKQGDAPNQRAPAPTTHPGSCSDYTGNGGHQEFGPDHWLCCNEGVYGQRTSATGTLITARYFGADKYYHVSFAEIRDGLSNTLLLGEKHVHPDWLGHYYVGDAPSQATEASNDQSIYIGHWGFSCVVGPGFPIIRDPRQPKGLMPHFGSWHPGVCQFALADGSVRAISVSVSETVMGNLAQRSSGEVISADAFQ